MTQGEAEITVRQIQNLVRQEQWMSSEGKEINRRQMARLYAQVIESYAKRGCTG